MWNVNSYNCWIFICQVLAKQNTAGLLRGRITETIVSQVLTLDTNYLKSHGALIGQLWTVISSDWSEVWVDSRIRLNIFLIIKMKITLECPSDCDVAAKICKTLSLNVEKCGGKGGILLLTNHNSQTSKLVEPSEAEQIKFSSNM